MTFEYTAFDGERNGVRANVLVRRSFAEVPFAMTTSDPTTGYGLTVGTGGVPTPLVIDYTQTGYYRTQVALDPSWGDVVGPGRPEWHPGDAPMWTAAGMSTVYFAGEIPQDFSKGTVAVDIRDCAGAPVDGVTVTLSPPAEHMMYQGFDGAPSADTETALPWGHVAALNAPVGAVHVSATHETRTIVPQDVVVTADQNVLIVLLRAID